MDQDSPCGYLLHLFKPPQKHHSPQRKEKLLEKFKISEHFKIYVILVSCVHTNNNNNKTTILLSLIVINQKILKNHFVRIVLLINELHKA